MIIHDVNDVFGRGFTLKASGPAALEKREAALENSSKMSS